MDVQRAAFRTAADVLGRDPVRVDERKWERGGRREPGHAAGERERVPASPSIVPAHAWQYVPVSACAVIPAVARDIFGRSPAHIVLLRVFVGIRRAAAHIVRLWHLKAMVSTGLAASKATNASERPPSRHPSICLLWIPHARLHLAFPVSFKLPRVASTSSLCCRKPEPEPADSLAFAAVGDEPAVLGIGPTDVFKTRFRIVRAQLQHSEQPGGASSASALLASHVDPAASAARAEHGAPPTPGEDDSVPAPAPAPLLTPPSSPPHPPHSAPSTKTSFRESLTLRTHRFSLSPPTQPPASALPPRPDEAPIARSHRRSISSGNTTLAPIPASPTPLVPPFPPPNGPLPPTPHSGPPSASPAGLLKRRLRMLSAPSPSPPPAGPPPPAPAPPSPAPSTINPYSIPSTPIGEPIMTFQNDPCFLFTTPPTPPPQYPLPQTPRLLPPPPEQSPEMHGLTSLSPPPRHGSRRISTQDEEKDEREEGGRPERDEQEEAHSTENSTATSAGRPSLPLSLSPHHSISSLEDVFI
ncbi:hypothetical protein A0H81_11084 [Grifola frondosa]|uniref:Uncharacterized protein n=1 Tax=Grifola frondosa TaxID=5627 RepID=A0A1C7LWB7_GRIFR|nr:hypothetical protein A0H81_11084 [Grifola frondosa]